MSTIPFYIPLLFVLITFMSVYLFYRASGKHKAVLPVIFIAMAIEAALAFTGFFTVTDTIPPRLLLLFLASVVAVVLLFSTEKGRMFIDGFNTKALTLLHTIRILVEVVLFFLFLEKLMPRLMTFEGRNMDILSGITAPLIYYFVWVRKAWDKRILLVWNATCLLILAFTVGFAVLSAPTPFQQFGFDQPTVAVLYFPFIWLPGIVVPIVYFSHLVAISKLWKEYRSVKTETA
jgi:hypothetical protein